MHQIGDFSFEVLAHATVIQRNGRHITDMLGRPRNLGAGGVLEQFDVRVFYQGEPLPWGALDFPAEPHREIFEFYGQESVDVYDDKGEKAGTKRGADFRTRFWPSLVNCAEKALAARTLGKPLKDVLDSDFDKVLLVEPVELKTVSIDEAAARLVAK